MKKLLSTILAALLCVSLFAQININGGYLHATYNVSGSDIGGRGSLPGNGFYVGVGYEIKMSNYSQLSFAPSLNFNLIDCNWSGSRFNNIFMSAPLHIRYTQPLNSSDLFISAGPSLICDLEDGAFDTTLGVGGGIILSNHLKLMLGYDFGLINQIGDGIHRITRNILHLGVGYKF